MPTDPSKMDKRSREYKAWAAQRASGPESGAPEKADAVGPDAPEDSVGKPDEVVLDVNHKEPVGAKAPTRPWERMNENRPFRRDYFALKRKNPGFRCRFVDPQNVEARLQRGYQVANPKDYGGLVDIDIRDTSGLGKVLTRHGMVLMEIPDEGARAYEKHQRDLIASRKRSAKAELEKEAASVGVKLREARN